MSVELKKSIIQTLSYFDQFNYPLTYRELYQWLWEPPVELPSFPEFVEILEQESFVETKDGFAYLSGREEIVQDRQNRKKFGRQKIAIAQKGINKITWIPFIKAIYICNTLALGTADEDSDIDLFIVVKKKRLWMTRLIITIVTSLLRIRRHGAQVTDRLCLSFYVTEDAMDFSHITIQDPDVYFAYWLATLLPVYDPSFELENLYKENQWLVQYLPYALNVQKQRTSLLQYRGVRHWIKKSLEWLFGSLIGDITEYASKWMQKKLMSFTKNSVRDLPDTRVVISDKMLKFHENDRRELFKDRWEHIIQKYSF